MSLENKTHLGEKWIKLKASFSNILLNPALEKDSYVNAFDDAYTLMMFRQFRVIHDGLRELIREHLQAKVGAHFLRQPWPFLLTNFFLTFSLGLSWSVGCPE